MEVQQPGTDLREGVENHVPPELNDWEKQAVFARQRVNMVRKPEDSLEFSCLFHPAFN